MLMCKGPPVLRILIALSNHLSDHLASYSQLHPRESIFTYPPASHSHTSQLLTTRTPWHSIHSWFKLFIILHSLPGLILSCLVQIPWLLASISPYCIPSISFWYICVFEYSLAKARTLFKPTPLLFCVFAWKSALGWGNSIIVRTDLTILSSPMDTGMVCAMVPQRPRCWRIACWPLVPLGDGGIFSRWGLIE